MGSKGSNTTSSSTTSAPDWQAQAAYRDLLTRAGQVASTPYQAYTGPLSAGTNAQQNLGVATANTGAGFANPFISQAAQLTGSSVAPVSGNDIAQYYNPYQQSVIDTTTNQLQADFGQQRAQLQGNNIAQGALGGSGSKVAQAILAGQQARTLGSTTAGLQSAGYNTALQAAQADKSRGLAGANSLAQYGLGGQNAALQAAQLQYGLGTQQQATDQAALDRLYQQYAQAQAFPYQQTQWLAGIDTGVGSSLGGTSSGQTTGPAPNSTGQWVGAGLTAASLFLSDKRAKTDIERVGEMDDGTTIYRYRYRGDPSWRIGPMAQEVDQDHVVRGADGMRYMDLKGVTDDAVERATGGGVMGYASGGSPVPFQDAAGGGLYGASWIPQIGIHGGSGAPQAHAPSLPSQQSGDPSKLAGQITGLGKAASGLDWGGAWSGLTGGDGLSGDSWGGGSFWKGDAYGGSSSNPLTGDPLDYGEGFATGGGVVGFPGVVRGYADGGDPTFDERFAGEPRVMENPRIPVAELGEGIDPTRLAMEGTVNPNDPVRTLGSTFGPEGPPGPVQAMDDGEEPPAPAARGVAGRPPVMAYDGPGPGAYYRRPDESARGAGLLGLISPNAQTGLLTAGLGMLSSRSPFLGNVIGEGGLAGVGAYGRAEEHDRKVAAEADKLAREAEATRYERWMGERKQGETERHNFVTEKREAEKGFKPTWGVVDEDPLTGRKIYGWIDPNKMTTSRGQQPAGDKGGIAANLSGEEYLKALEQANPEMARTVKGVADYRINPASLSQRGGMREKVLERALRYNPDYDQTQFTAKNGARRVFASGPEGRTVRSLNVSIDHLETLEEAAKALNNGNIPLFNQIANVIREKTGSPVTTNFDSIKQVVSAEIAKAVVGGQTALHDREDMAQRARNSQSPAQLMGIFGEFKKLMAGQMKGLRRQYESQTKLTDFDSMLEPGTIKALKGLEHGAKGPGEGGFTPPPGALSQVHNGKTYYYDPQTKQPYPGQ